MLLDEDRMQSRVESPHESPMPAASTAASASSTAPGPSGMPGLAHGAGEMDDVLGEAAVLVGGRRQRLMRLRLTQPSERSQLGALSPRSALRLRALDLRDVVLIFEQHAERIGDLRRIERDRVEFGERRRPVQGLGDARRLEQVLFAQASGRRRRVRRSAAPAPAAPWRARSPSRARGRDSRPSDRGSGA